MIRRTVVWHWEFNAWFLTTSNNLFCGLLNLPDATDDIYFLQIQLNTGCDQNSSLSSNSPERSSKICMTFHDFPGPRPGKCDLNSRTFQDLYKPWMESYAKNDVLGHTGDWSEHTRMLRLLWKGPQYKFVFTNAKLGLIKWIFWSHTLQKDSIAQQNETVCKTVITWRPKTKKRCRSLLGMVNFYRWHVLSCAEIIASITELTKNTAPELVKWGDSQEEAFTEIKRLLSNEPKLKLPDLEWEFILQTDASNQSLGACLLQENDGLNTQCCMPARSCFFRNRTILLVSGRHLL